MIYIRYFTFTLLMGWASAVSSEGASDDYIQSQKCSGALSIMTSIGLSDDTAPIYKYFADLADFHSFILEYYVSERIDNYVMGDVTLAVSRGVVLVDDEASSDPNSLQATVKHCLSWLSVVKLHFDAQDPSSSASEVFGALPKPSDHYEYPFSDWTPLIPIVETAYELWVGAGLRDIQRCLSTGNSETIYCYTLPKE